MIYEDTDLIPEDATNPKKKKRRKRPDPKRSRAAKKAAKQPGAKKNRAKARKKFTRSSEGKQFFRKLGKFNSRRAMMKKESNLRWGVLALQDFLGADPPVALREKAEELYGLLSQGRIGVTDLDRELDGLAEAADGR